MKTDSEFSDRIDYFYLQTDGSHNFPDSAEGDILKIGHAEIKALRAEVAKAIECFNAQDDSAMGLAVLKESLKRKE